MTGTRSGGGALRKQECRVPLLQALDEKSSKLEDFWNAKTEVVRNKLDRHGAADTSWIESIAECPVYYPTKDDFMQDPLHFIQKIAEQASKFGICKIVSPVVASVPAGVVLSKEQLGFKFTTRVQPLRLSNWDKDDKITFPMSGRNYTLTEYEKMANRVFSRKFSTAGNLPPRFIESEFWKELAVGKTRTVEYATDVEGSAFSNSSMDSLGQSKWNLKGISRLPYSTLRLLEDAIPGVTEPMLYIGMLFSMFSWHIEDHYLYSINYQHCGAPKTWYGVPGDAALCFEKVVQEHVYNTELLRDTGKGAELDLLLEKTTMFTPKLLAEQGVPVFKAVQYPGEFIVTFPRAYHAGFSHGFNCGEAVNFAMADWFFLGAEACSRYEFLNRFPLLPHEMLLCKEASIISQINRTGHDSLSCDLQAHVKVAFVTCMRSLLQSMSSLKRRGAKTTTSKETSVLCGLCKHICHVAYTSCKCFPEPTCFNHGEFFSACTCSKGARMIFLKDDFADLEAIAQKFEIEVDIRNRVQKLLLQNDSLEREDVSRVAEDMQFEKSSLVDVKDSGECCLTQGDNEKADTRNHISQLESCDGATSLYCRQGHEEELSDTEVVQFKRRKVSLPQSKRFQVDEQELAPEKIMVSTLKISDCPKIESSCSSARNHSLKLASLDNQAMAGVAELDKVTVNITHEPFDTSSDSEFLRERKKLRGALVKVKRRRLTATAKDSVLPAEFDVHCAVKQVAETKHVDSRNSSDFMLGSTRSIDGSAPVVEEGQNLKIDSFPASEGMALEGKEMEQTPCIESMNKDGFSHGRNDADLVKLDTGVSPSMDENLLDHTSVEAVRIETDPPVEIMRNSTHETNLTENLITLNSRNTISNPEEVDTTESIIGNKANDANGGDDAHVTAPEAAIFDEGKPSHPEGNCPSCEFRGCETDQFVLKTENFLLAEAQPSVDLVEDQKARKILPSSGAESMPLKDCGKSETASVSSSEPKKGLVIHLNRKLEQIPRKKVADVLHDEDKSSICENLMEQVDILEGQSGGTAWCLDQEVVSSYSDQNDCKQLSPLRPSTLNCDGDLVEDHLKSAEGGEFLEEKFDLKPEGLLETEQLIVEQQGSENRIRLQDDFCYKFRKPSPHFESNNHVEGAQIHEGESSSTQYSFAMQPLVPGCTSVTIEGQHKLGVLDNIDALSCRKNTISPADFSGWQKSEVSSQVASEVTRGLSSAGVSVYRDSYLQEFTLTDTRLDARNSRLDSSNLHQNEGHASNFVEKPLYQARNFGAVDFEHFPGKSMNWSPRRLQGHADFSSHYSTGHTPAMCNKSHRVGPPHNYKPRSFHRNYHPLQIDNTRVGKYPRSFQRKTFSRWERRPRRYYSRDSKGVSLQNNRSSFGADNPRVKGVFDAGFSAASSSAGSVEGYDPMKWEISPVATPWQFSSASHHFPSVWPERRP